MLRTDVNDTIATPLWLVIALVVALSARVVATIYDKLHPPTESSVIAWKTDYKPIDVLDAKPLLYYFSARWSASCTRMDQETFHSTDLVSLINDRFVPIKVVDRSIEDGKNPEAVQSLVDKYGVSSFPTVVLALSDGTYIASDDGFLRRARMNRFVKWFLPMEDFCAGREAFARGEFATSAECFKRFMDRPDSKKDKDLLSKYRFAAAWRYIALKCIGRNDEAKKELDEAVQLNSSEKKWPYPLLLHLAGREKYDNLRKEDRPEMNADMAILKYAEHDEQGCLKYLNSVLPNTAYRAYTEYRAALFVLHQLPESVRAPLEKKYLF